MRIFIVMLILCLGGTALAQGNSTHARDEEALQTIVGGLTKAWDAGDAKAMAELFAPDADFTIVTGQYIKGREAIEHGHDQIFKTFYKDTTLNLSVRSVRFLSDTVAAVHLEASIIKKGAASPMIRTVPLLILVKDKGHWQIAVFQNTDVHMPQLAQ